MLHVEHLPNGSPDAPLIRIFGTDTDACVGLARTLEEFAAGRVERVCLTEMPDFREVPPCRLILQIGTTNIGVLPSSPRTFIWTQTAKAWHLAAGLAEPFTQQPSIGSFQWLAGRESSVPSRAGSLSVVLSFSAEGQW